MTLDYWLFKNKVTRVKMAHALGLHPQTLIGLLKKKTVPLLNTALAIQKYTNEEIDLIDLLNEEDAARIEKIVPFS